MIEPSKEDRERARICWCGGCEWDACCIESDHLDCQRKRQTLAQYGADERERVKLELSQLNLDKTSAVYQAAYRQGKAAAWEEAAKAIENAKLWQAPNTYANIRLELGKLVRSLSAGKKEPPESPPPGPGKPA